MWQPRSRGQCSSACSERALLRWPSAVVVIIIITSMFIIIIIIISCFMIMVINPKLLL